MINTVMDIEGVKEIGIGSWLVYAAYKTYMVVQTIATTGTTESIFGIITAATLFLLVAVLIVASAMLGGYLIVRGVQQEMN